MTGHLEKALQTPFSTLARIGLSRARRTLARTLRRAQRGLPGRPVRTSVREERAFFCTRDLRESPSEFLSLLGKLWPASLPRILAAAADGMSHRFDLLGSGPVELGEKINWHRDWKSGKVWPRLWFERIVRVNPGDDSDIKVPWELSRFYHLVELGKAYALGAGESCTREFLAQVEDWEKENPVGFGVNWCCAMEVAIRAINLLWAYCLFRGSALLSRERAGSLARLLFSHGRFIRANLEFDQRLVGGTLVRTNGNHYIADLAGLLYLGVMLEGREPEAWLAFALQELSHELDVQVLPDGAHWELAPAYHRLVLELLTGCACLCRANSIPLPAELLPAIRRMGRFLEGCLRPDGTSPLVRDADDGRVTPLGRTDYRDHRHLVAPVGLLSGAASLPADAKGHGEDVLWLMGMDACRRMLTLPTRPPQSDSRGFPDAGYYVMRGGGLHVMAVCARGGMGGLHSGHAHCDALSFELTVQDTTFLCDSGTYVYSGSSEWRNRFRSTPFHNTARVDGVEINSFNERALFAMADNARPTVTSWQHTPRRDVLLAEHHGYERLESPVTHRRGFVLDKEARTLLVSDSFSGRGEHLVEIFFTVHPGCSVMDVDDGTFRIFGPGCSLLLGFQRDGGWSVRREQGWVSERYGRKQATVRLVLSRRGGIPVSHQARCVVSGP